MRFSHFPPLVIFIGLLVLGVMDMELVADKKDDKKDAEYSKRADHVNMLHVEKRLQITVSFFHSAVRMTNVPMCVLDSTFLHLSVDWKAEEENRLFKNVQPRTSLPTQSCGWSRYTITKHQLVQGL